MKKELLFFTLCFLCLSVQAEEDPVKKTNIFVRLPEVLDESGKIIDTLTFKDMRKTIEMKVNSFDRAHTCQDYTHCEYFLSTFITGVEKKYASAYELHGSEGVSHGLNRGEYRLSFFITHYLFYVPLSERQSGSVRLDAKHLVGKTVLEPKSFYGSKGYDEAIKGATLAHPGTDIIHKLLDDALAVRATIVGIVKNASGKDVVSIDKGYDDGIAEDQWFDVFLKNADGSTGEKLGTIQVESRESHRSVCQLKKNSGTVLSAVRRGTPIVAISRESTNIFKKTREAWRDFKLNGRKE